MRISRFSVGRVEDGRGRLGPMAIAPFPIPAHRTGLAELPHPALRLASLRGTRRGIQRQAFEAQETTFIDDLTGEPPGPASCHFMSARKEVAHALVDVAIDRSVCRTVAIRSVLEIGLEDGLQHNLGRGLRNPVANGGDTERTLTSAISFRDHRSPHRIGPVRLRNQFLAQARQPSLQALFLDLGESHSIHTRRSRVGAGAPVSVEQYVLPADFVIEHIEAESGLRLRLAIELSLKAPDLFRFFKAHRQSPSLPSSKAHQKSGSFALPALPGFVAPMTLSDSRRDRRLKRR